MATVEQIQALLEKQAVKIGQDVETKVTEKLADYLVKKVVDNLGPVLKSHIVEEVAKAVDPVLKLHEQTDKVATKLVNDLANLTSKVNSQKDEMNKKKEEGEIKKRQEESELKKRQVEAEMRQEEVKLSNNPLA